MQWTNPGHQFDAIGNDLKNFKNIYIYGASDIGKNILKLVTFLEVEISFIDKDLEKQQKGVEGYQVYSPEEFKEKCVEHDDGFIVVFTVNRSNYLNLAKEFIRKGYRENVDFFFYDVFEKFYLNILSVYKFNKIFVEQLSLMVTTYCTLKCKDCIISMPYQKEKRHVPLSELKKDVELFFSKVDFVRYFGPGGGEIFLYPNLDQFLEYVLSRFSKQIGEVLLISNATVLPNEKVLRVIKKYNLAIRISNYENVRGWLEKRKKFVSLCEDNGVAFREQKEEYWLDMGWNSEKKNAKLTYQLFEQCEMPCREFSNGIEYYCLHGHFAEMAKGIHEDQGLDFTKEETDKKMILEYNMGYLKKGFLNSCIRCNGYFGVNNKRIPVAEQL